MKKNVRLCARIDEIRDKKMARLQKKFKASSRSEAIVMIVDHCYATVYGKASA